jgi:hypothetical protein
MFVSFINNKLDKLVSPEVMLKHKDEKHVMNLLKQAIGTDTRYRADIASVLCTRFANYAIVHSEENPITDEMIERITELTTNEVFGNDLKYYAIREMMSRNKAKFQKLLANKEVAKDVLK